MRLLLAREFSRINTVVEAFVRFSFLASALLALAGCQAAEVYPHQPILLICPWAVGGGTDRLSREIAVFLEQDLGVPVNVVNATGGAGVTGHSRGARARPDGYTLTMMTVELNMLHWRELTDISWDDFTPLMLINRDPAAVFVRADESRWEGLADLAGEVRRSPGALTASGTATGGIWHLALAGWLKAAGLGPVDIKWIPMNGAGPALQELASGGIDLVSCSLPEARILLESGQVRSLGVMAPERVEEYPEVPTFRELGIEWTMVVWRGLGLPKGTPERVRATLSRALFRIVSGETLLNGVSFPEFMKKEGFNLTWATTSEFRALLERTDQELGSILTSPEFSAVNESRFEPMDFPSLLFGATGVILLILAIRSFTGSRTIKERSEQGISAQGIIHFFEIVLSVVIFVLFAEKLGFVLTAAGVVFLLVWRLGTRSWVAALLTLFIVPAVYELFANLLRVPLPRGLLGW